MIRRAAALAGIAAIAARIARAADDIRALRGPKTLLTQWPLAALLTGAALLALAGYLGWRHLHRARTMPPSSPAERALAELEAARALLATASAGEFCDAVSGVMRRYLESQFALDASRRTTEEFLQELSARPVAAIAAHQPLLAGFLQHCDLVRFSGSVPGTLRLEALYQAARRFIIDTTASEHDPVPAT